MAILVNESTRVLVQGITGREGRARAKLMRDYGTQVVAGCTPGRGGETVDGTPVYDTVCEAVEATGGIDASVIFVPAPLVKDAALESVAAWRSHGRRSAPVRSSWAPTPSASSRSGKVFSG